VEKDEGALKKSMEKGRRRARKRDGTAREIGEPDFITAVEECKTGGGEEKNL